MCDCIRGPQRSWSEIKRCVIVVRDRGERLIHILRSAASLPAPPYQAIALRPEAAIQRFLDRFHQTMDSFWWVAAGDRDAARVSPARSASGIAGTVEERDHRRGERFCAAYPDDPVCHFKDRGSRGATRSRRRHRGILLGRPVWPQGYGQCGQVDNSFVFN